MQGLYYLCDDSVSDAFFIFIWFIAPFTSLSARRHGGDRRLGAEPTTVHVQILAIQ